MCRETFIVFLVYFYWFYCVGNSENIKQGIRLISIQTFNSQSFTEKTTSDFYDYIIVDEFHHAAAPTYQKLLSYYNPQILLGLTATPERMDGKSILPYFNNRIAAEIRLPEAIDRKLLCPFQYFGVTDTVDLDHLKWAAGGYDKGELSRVYTLSGMTANRRADLVVSSLLKYVTDIDDVRGLGFCVTVEHAEFMSNYIRHGSREEKVLKLLCRNEESLTKNLNNRQKEIFNKFTDCQKELSGITTRQSLCRRVQLGSADYG